jgi:hypothetical protein
MMQQQARDRRGSAMLLSTPIADTSVGDESRHDGDAATAAAIALMHDAAVATVLSDEERESGAAVDAAAPNRPHRVVEIIAVPEADRFAALHGVAPPPDRSVTSPPVGSVVKCFVVGGASLLTRPIATLFSPSTAQQQQQQQSQLQLRRSTLSTPLAADPIRLVTSTSSFDDNDANNTNHRRHSVFDDDTTNNSALPLLSCVQLTPPPRCRRRRRHPPRTARLRPHRSPPMRFVCTRS